VFCGIVAVFYYSTGFVIEEKSVTGEVVSVSERSMSSGAVSIYTIYLELETESEEEKVIDSFSTDLFSVREVKKVVANLESGDKVLLKYNWWHDLYYCEVLSTYKSN
jgi:hypothetical protein